MARRSRKAKQHQQQHAAAAAQKNVDVANNEEINNAQHQNDTPQVAAADEEVLDAKKYLKCTLWINVLQLWFNQLGQLIIYIL